MQGVGGWEESRPFISNRIKELLYLPRVPYGQEEARYLRSGHNKKKHTEKGPSHTHTHTKPTFFRFFLVFFCTVFRRRRVAETVAVTVRCWRPPLLGPTGGSRPPLPAITAVEWLLSNVTVPYPEMADRKKRGPHDDQQDVSPRPTFT